MRSDVSRVFMVTGAASALVGPGLIVFGVAAVAGVSLMAFGVGTAAIGALFREAS